MTRTTVDLSRYDNSQYSPGRSALVRACWLLVNRAFFLTALPWPSSLRRALLRLFGARVGRDVVIKPRVNIKYPWNVSIGDYSWIGEAVWLDSVGRIEIGAHCCLSQGAMVETGNHDWSSETFDLVVRPVRIEDGSWAAARSLLLPGSQLRSHAVLGAASTLAGIAASYSIYSGVPAVLIRERPLSESGLSEDVPARATTASGSDQRA